MENIRITRNSIIFSDGNYLQLPEAAREKAKKIFDDHSVISIEFDPKTYEVRSTMFGFTQAFNGTSKR